MLVALAHRLAVYAGQNGRLAIRRHRALGAPDDVLALVARSAANRPRAHGLVPYRNTTPYEVRHLDGVA